MCGIFGVIADNNKHDVLETIKIMEDLGRLSQARGKDSSGFAFRIKSSKYIEVIRGPVAIVDLIKTNDYKTIKEKVVESYKLQHNDIFAAIGHARLVTNGSQLNHTNNQPVFKDGIVGVHNGIIVNVDELWSKYKDMKRDYEIDTEVMYALFRKFLNEQNNTITAIRHVEKEIIGTVSTGFFIDDLEEMPIFTNNGSLYLLTNNQDYFVFASEGIFIKKLVNMNRNKFDHSYNLSQLHSNTGCVLDFADFSLDYFDLRRGNSSNEGLNTSKAYTINILNYHTTNKQLPATININEYKNIDMGDKCFRLLENNIDKISELVRCVNCLLPVTFPFIEFDEDGICNYCNNYVKKNEPKKIEELQLLVEPYRCKKGKPDCLIPFSGGRDSTFTLHIVKNVLGMNPIAFTYDWGMVTDLARRNIARVCGKLGVENIIVAANIQWKRENIKKNILAWLKNPELGMVPLFMAGDKYFFYYADIIKKQNDIKLNIWGVNPLENTDFKVGYCGIQPRFNKKRIYSLSAIDAFKLFGFVGKNMFRSPTYINQSLLDTFGSFTSRYVSKKEDYFHMFDYYGWNEKEIEELILSEYKWEKANDTNSTWRIGDGTASFYNYIYYTVAGFSENDTFRSNQIREGMISREDAMLLVAEENIPRYDSIKWYLDIVGLDFEYVIKAINNIPKLY